MFVFQVDPAPLLSASISFSKKIETESRLIAIVPNTLTAQIFNEFTKMKVDDLTPFQTAQALYNARQMAVGLFIFGISIQVMLLIH